MLRFPLARRPEIIGHEDCPLIHRWTIATWGDGSRLSSSLSARAEGGRGGKLLLHRFLPHADDRSVHDHPRGFWTIVLRGGYDDLAPCDTCEGSGTHFQVLWEGPPERIALECETCDGDGVILNERMRAGMIRHRPAEHRHRTKVHPKGCWTLVIMGRLERQWGFWVGGRWLGFREYEERYGEAMRCD